MNRTNALISSNELGRLGTLFRQTPLSRGEFFAALFLIACVNALASRVIQSVSEEGLAAALLSTFGVSVIVFIACCVGITFIFHDRSDAIRNSDLAAGIPFLAIAALPFDKSSWFAVTGLALYIITCTKRGSRRLRGAVDSPCNFILNALESAFVRFSL